VRQSLTKAIRADASDEYYTYQLRGQTSDQVLASSLSILPRI
jgi:hypothetical protein